MTQRLKKRAYVGLRDSQREKFTSHHMPTKQTHPQYDAVVGPFRTGRGAEYFVNNPLISSRGEAEREALKLGEQRS